MNKTPQKRMKKKNTQRVPEHCFHGAKLEIRGGARNSEDTTIVRISYKLKG